MTSSLLMTSKCSAYLLNIFLYLCGVFFLALCTPLHFNDDFEPVDDFQEPRLSFKSMERDSDGHGLPALKTHSGYVEELEKSLKSISSSPEDLEKRVRCGRARMAMQ
eukprot:s2805_g18.t1